MCFVLTQMLIKHLASVGHTCKAAPPYTLENLNQVRLPLLNFNISSILGPHFQFNALYWRVLCDYYAEKKVSVRDAFKIEF